ncbi:uncharacterized protein LOC127846013 [Dreissena polymorpha]|uniref:uncharacterized protein LOC127846013 n=1 Tax=Dreissena polymorpha TaxID=45954 RepID=UPI002264CA31|nr:uncharacterized protein LOC127846013 [Dreissena polymorpha]
MDEEQLKKPSVGHECKRKCEVGRPMVCEYNFTVENYFTLSRACHSCPFEEADCFRPHCISTNGLKKNVLAVNREIPGPAIEVCVGDTVRVWVRNRMEDGSATSLHWHGLRQRNSNIMDGASRLTQCDVAPGHDFRYRISFEFLHGKFDLF